VTRDVPAAAPAAVVADTSPEFCRREIMLPSGASSSTRGTAVHTAASKCSVGALHVLLLLGADMNAISHQHLTPLHQAITGKALWSVIYLLSAGARTDVPDAVGVTAAKLAATCGVPVLHLALQRMQTGRNGLQT